MTSSLRVRASIVLLLGTLLIPVATSSLRGLTHVLSCSSPVAARFDVEVPLQGKDPEAVLLNPTVVTRPGGGAQPDHLTRPVDDGHVTRPATTQPDSITRPADGASTTVPAATSAPSTLPPETSPPETVVVTQPPTSTTTKHRKPPPVCGGITIDMHLSAPSPGWIRVDLPVTNSGRHNWKGTLQLQVGTKVFPVELGSISPGNTRSKSIEVRVDTKITRVTSELLLGP